MNLHLASIQFTFRSYLAVYYQFTTAEYDEHTEKTYVCGSLLYYQCTEVMLILLLLSVGFLIKDRMPVDPRVSKKSRESEMRILLNPSWNHPLL